MRTVLPNLISILLSLHKPPPQLRQTTGEGEKWLWTTQQVAALRVKETRSMLKGCCISSKPQNWAMRRGNGIPAKQLKNRWNPCQEPAARLENQSTLSAEAWEWV